MRKLNLFALAFIVAVATLSSCSNNNGSETKGIATDTIEKMSSDIDTPTTVVPPPPGNSTTDAVKPAPKDVEITKKDTAKTDEIIFVVKNINEPEIDREISVTKPEDSEKYIAVQFWVKNISDHSVSLNEEDFIISDQEDADYVEKRAFTEHRKSPILFKMEGPLTEPLVFRPNESKSGWVTFTTSKTSQATKIKYKNITVKL